MNAASRLYVSAETAAVIEAAEQAVFLVGGYDGSGNIGDILQLRGALELVGAYSRAVRIPVLELEQAASHADLTARAPATFPCEGVAFLDGSNVDGASNQFEQRVLELPSQSGVVTYLYGGGYLNRFWGARKLAMLGAVDAATREAGRVPAILSSGLQLSPMLTTDVGSGAVDLLDRLVTVGVRDPVSRGIALSLLSGSPADEVLLTGDDAVGVIRRWRPLGPPRGDGVAVLLHVSGEDYATADPAQRVDWVTTVAAELARRRVGGIRAIPLVAYDDRRRSERGVAERLVSGLAAADVECGEPIVLVEDPAATRDLLATTGPRLVISSSYHVALISLLLGIPAALVVENDYYRQKAAGLEEGFELPGDLLLDPSADPAVAAARLAPIISGGAVSDDLAAVLNRGRDRLVRRRLDAEDVLRARFARLETDLLGHRTDDEGRRPEAGTLEELLDERTDLLVRQFDAMAELHGERDRLLRDLEDGAVELERLQQELSRQAAQAGLVEDRLRESRAQLAAALAEAERLRRWLDTIHSSSSWRLTAPLRAMRRLGRSEDREHG